MSRKCAICGTSFPDSVAFCGNDGNLTIQELGAGAVDTRLGATVGEYVVVAQIADGAMGRVYEGRHAKTKQRVAIKILHPDIALDAVSVERFKREADTARELEHPNVVKVIDFGQTEDGSHFMTMEYLEGEELGHLVRRDGAMAPARIVRIISQLAVALDHAHSFGVIHRDLKPDNVFLVQSDAGDIVRILDFGSVKLQVETGAKLTAFGTTLGSPYYMSPEQAMGKQDVDSRTDVFACTAILYEMLTGKIAFEGPNVAQILMKIMNEQPTGPSLLGKGVPAGLDDVIDKGLRKDKSRRYGSVGALADGAVHAFGLSGASVDWAKKPQVEIAAALGATTPPPPRPFGVESLPPPPRTGTVTARIPMTGRVPQPASMTSHEDDGLASPKQGLSPLAMVGLAVGVLVVLGVLGSVAAFFALR